MIEESSGSEGGHYSLDWTTGLTFDLKCSIYMKYLCEKNYIERALQLASRGGWTHVILHHHFWGTNPLFLSTYLNLLQPRLLLLRL